MKRLIGALLLFLATVSGLYISQMQDRQATPEAPPTLQQNAEQQITQAQAPAEGSAQQTLEQLAVKGRAPKTGYTRTQFGAGWTNSGGCDTRNRILARDLKDILYEINSCVVLSGRLEDPYTGKTISFARGQGTSASVQIDHVVALSDAWQKGGQLLSAPLREQFANDGLNLLAVDGGANQQKSDGDAATWLPPNKPMRCSYVARQISVKAKYSLWITAAEKEAMLRVLKDCPQQQLTPQS